MPTKTRPMFATIRHLLALHAIGQLSTAALSAALAFEAEARAA